jgi:hypothetical protein
MFLVAGFSAMALVSVWVLIALPDPTVPMI